MDNEQTLRETSGPTMDRERIESLDILRGFALMGILVMNIQSFSMPSTAYLIPDSYGILEGLNAVVWLVGYLFFNLKFMAMFSMMFGAGIVLMSQHRDAAGSPVLRVHYRRMILLLIFGLAHAYLIWYGDILVPYAICGLFVVWARKWRPSRLIVGGIILIIIGSLFHTLVGVSGQLSEEGADAVRAGYVISEEQHQQEINAYLGSWSDHFPYRAQEALGMQLFIFPAMFFWRLCGLMCIGMALFKSGVLDAARSNTYYARMAVVGAIIGIPLVALGAYADWQNDFDTAHVLGYGSLPNYFGSIFVALMWIALIMLLCRADGFAKVRRVLSSYGRMAFTNYIGQSIIATWIFYGYGLGWFGSVSRVQQVGIVIAIWTLQLTISTIWLRYFRFGPLEWVWRTGAYVRLQPMRRHD